MRFPCDILVNIDPQIVKLGYLFNCISSYFKIKPMYNFVEYNITVSNLLVW